MLDLVIVGSGPAGAAAALAARAARPDASVLLLDRADFPRDKACGDAIGAHATSLLTQLGAQSAVAGYDDVEWFSLSMDTGSRRGPGFDSSEVRARLRPGTVTVPRTVFDARLVKAARAAGVDWHRHRVRRVDDLGDRVVLDGEIVARTVVAADGANSTLRRALGVPRNPDRAMAVAMRGYTRIDGPPAQRIVLDDTRWPAYGWVFVVGDGTANVGWGALRDGTAITRAEMVERTSAMAGGAAVDRLRAHHLPLTTARPPVAIGNVLLTGDAASLINPLSGEGIYYALLSGTLAGRAAVTAAKPGMAYRAALRRRLGRHLRHTTAASRLLDRRALRHAGVRAATDPAVFTPLTELALGDGTLTPAMVRGLVRALHPVTRG